MNKRVKVVNLANLYIYVCARVGVQHFKKKNKTKSTTKIF